MDNDYTLGANIEELYADTSKPAHALRLTGNALANVIGGNDGDNTLDGGGGADTLEGFLGNDTYIVDNAGDVITEEVDGGRDTAVVSLNFSMGSLANVEIIRLADGTEATRLTGGDGDNWLIGNTNFNIIDGGLGADTMEGGAGSDVFIVDNAADVVIETAAGGSQDAIQTSISYTLAANLDVEYLTAIGTEAIDLTGNQLANTISGNGAANRLDGGTGADTMWGGNGDDLYLVDNANDAAMEGVGGGTDTVQASVSFTLDAESEVEFLTAMGNAAINLTGSRFANTLTGNAAANRLDGGAGADTMAGGAGNDIYLVDNAGDKVVEAAAGGVDAVQTTISYALASDAEVEYLTAVGTGNLDLTGNQFANIISGNAGANRLDGGAGADMMAGGAGNDTYLVDNAGDQVSDTAGQGIDRVLASASFTLAATAEIEFLEAAVATAVSLTGSAFANTVSGNAGADILKGMDGDDVVSGAAGNDKVFGGLGRDMLLGGVGKDIFVFDTAVAKKKNANIDKLADFNVKDDTIHLENAIFKALGKKGSIAKPQKLKKDAFFHGSKAHDRDDRVIVSKNGKIYYDADGTGHQAQIQIGTVTAKVAKAMTEKDFMII